MTGQPAKLRRAENEVYFREQNENVQKGFDRINKIAEEQGDEKFDIDTSMPLNFYCECFDEQCKKRLIISMDAYKKVHKTEKIFIVYPKHNDKTIETVVEKKPEYWVVEKIVKTPKVATKLNKTNKTTPE